jgi:hypothetical protein
VHGLVYKEDHGPAMLKKEKEGKERGDGMCMCKKMAWPVSSFCQAHEEIKRANPNLHVD